MSHCEDETRDPLDRINYIDGQRLTQQLLQAEQDFHIRLREWLSKSLFTSGVADGLEVKVVEDKVKKGKVAVVCPGLAIDKLGRAIVLVNETEELVITGRYLTIMFDEVHVRQTSDGCLTGATSSGTATKTAFRGDTLIRTKPKINFRNRWPEDDEMEIVLAEFAFKSFEDCTATGIRNGPRRFTTARQMAGIHTFALEGEKDLDLYNSKKLYFHIRGRTPTRVVLFLRADVFSSLYYSELGQHSHSVGVAGGEYTTGGASDVDDHSHNVQQSSINQVSTPVNVFQINGENFIPLNEDGTPNLDAFNVAAVSAFAFGYGWQEGTNIWDDLADLVLPGVGGILADAINDALSGTDHRVLLPTYVAAFEKIFDLSTENINLTWGNPLVNDNSLPPINSRHTHDFSVPDESGDAGATSNTGEPYEAVDGLPRLTTFNELFVYISYPGPDGKDERIDVTDQIRQQFIDLYGHSPTDWNVTPAGLPYKKLETDGTPEIRVDLLVNPEKANEQCLGKGQHFLEFQIFRDGDEIGDRREGGKVLYNLYVEAE